MNEKAKAKLIIRTLNKIYPKAPVPLNHKNTFTTFWTMLVDCKNEV